MTPIENDRNPIERKPENIYPLFSGQFFDSSKRLLTYYYMFGINNYANRSTPPSREDITMNAVVTQLYKNGKRLSADLKLREHVGDLHVNTGRNVVTGREGADATLLVDGGAHVIEPMQDVYIVHLTAKGLLLRGTEYKGGREVAQEWWCRFSVDGEERP